jgi:hypothetical protein
VTETGDLNDAASNNASGRQTYYFLSVFRNIFFVLSLRPSALFNFFAKKKQSAIIVKSFEGMQPFAEICCARCIPADLMITL